MKLELFEICKAFNEAIDRDFSERIKQTEPKTKDWYRLYHEIEQRHYLFLTGEVDTDGNRYKTVQECYERNNYIRKLFSEHMSEMTGNPAIGIWLLKQKSWRTILWDMNGLIEDKYYNKILRTFSYAAYANYVCFYRELFVNSYGAAKGEEMFEQMCAKFKPCFKPDRPYWQEKIPAKPSENA